MPRGRPKKVVKETLGIPLEEKPKVVKEISYKPVLDRPFGYPRPAPKPSQAKKGRKEKEEPEN